MSMGANHPSLFPMLRLWTIVLFCLFTYIHATATLGKEIARKAVRALSLVDSHGLLTLVAASVDTLVIGPFETSARTKKSAIQAQQAAA
jgi:hypothetical protein